MIRRSNKKCHAERRRARTFSLESLGKCPVPIRPLRN
jgi:hypothetical protein